MPRFYLPILMALLLTIFQETKALAWPIWRNSTANATTQQAPPGSLSKPYAPDSAPTLLNSPWGNTTSDGSDSAATINVSVAPTDWPQPVWMPCAQSSQHSYINFTFHPYPIRRMQNVNLTIQGKMQDDIPTGTYLQLSSWNKYLPFLPGPSAKVDICSFISKQFPDAPTPVKCPINQWAIQLVLHAIGVQSQSNGSSSSGLQFGSHVPWYIFGGNYTTTVQLKTQSGDDITCASTEIVVA